jgi:branched-chain amino acid transport system substrate-binding protein
VVGGDLASSDWFDSPWFFPQGASVADQAIGLIRNGVELGHTHVGLLYCVEASTCAEADHTIRTRAARAAGGELVYDAPVSITATDYTAQCLGAKNARVDQLVLAVDGSSMTRIARSCEAVQYRPLLSTAGGIISPAQATDATLRSFGLATVTTGAPWMLDDTPGLRDLHRSLALYQPRPAPDGASVIAWSSAKLLEAAIRNVLQSGDPRPITAATVLAGLAGIHRETLGGLTAPITFRPGPRPAVSSGCVFEELLTATGWTAPRGSKPICPPQDRN